MPSVRRAKKWARAAAARRLGSPGQPHRLGRHRDHIRVGIQPPSAPVPLDHDSKPTWRAGAGEPPRPGLVALAPIRPNPRTGATLLEPLRPAVGQRPTPPRTIRTAELHRSRQPVPVREPPPPCRAPAFVIRSASSTWQEPPTCLRNVRQCLRSFGTGHGRLHIRPRPTSPTHLIDMPTPHRLHCNRPPIKSHAPMHYSNDLGVFLLRRDHAADHRRGARARWTTSCAVVAAAPSTTPSTDLDTRPRDSTSAARSVGRRGTSGRRWRTVSRRAGGAGAGLAGMFGIEDGARASEDFVRSVFGKLRGPAHRASRWVGRRGSSGPPRSGWRRRWPRRGRSDCRSSGGSWRWPRPRTAAARWRTTT